MAGDREEKTLTAACHCRSVHFTVTVPGDALPLDVHLCHCSVCRYTHGALCSFHAPLPKEIHPEFISPSGLDKLTRYTHSQSKSTRFFCSNCGCHIGDRDHINGRWVVSSAIFDHSGDETVWRISSHIYANGSTKGGLFEFVPRIMSREVTLSNSGNQQDETAMQGNLKAPECDDRSLRAECHCGGVSFNISRPSRDFVDDLANRKWVLEGKEDKWLGALDVCDDCRLVSGTNVAAWMFVPVSYISPSPPDNLLIGSSKRYSSSEEVVRTFCGTCGAVVFYSCSDRPGVVDIAVGILRDPKSVLAESWVVWRTGRIAHFKDGIRYDPVFTESLGEGLQLWGKERHGEVLDFVIG
ncbi:Mss4-like protein [Aspergillus bertholletiae]|uniref:Mss4-like protein n=1 Tax=Aspergillus bertholletiae TaxID=1226010 RepID=A0A5N7BLN8_9EURO|nr:Mss4-like protein [Aspergillus bertholletiae]